MLPLDPGMLALIAAGALVIAVMALAALSAWPHRRREAGLFEPEGEGSVVFLFDEHRLVNATPAATQILGSAAGPGTEWDRLVATLLPRFPDLRDRLVTLPDERDLRIEEPDGDAVLTAEWVGGLSRLTLTEQDDVPNALGLDRYAMAALERELETLRATSEHVPVPVWRETRDGTITWANARYLEIADGQEPDREFRTWPPRRLFDTREFARAGSGSEAQRLAMLVPPRSQEGPGADERVWYDCHRADLGEEALYTAIPAAAAVRAESEREKFVQLLSRTFADLRTGLAVFDGNRTLSLFNPALSDMTLLSPEFLASRPAMSTFLERLREKRMMPEPRNYQDWRQQLESLESAAAEGRYEATWHIPSGEVYHVTGRPYDSGATVFMFDDISEEIALTRRLRSEIETGQAVLDTIDEAIAVFSGNGNLILTNAAYARLWETPEEELADVTILDASRTWHAKCAPSPIWGEARDFVGSLSERAEWTGEARLWDGRMLHCRFTPIGRGTTLIGFTPAAAALPAPGETPKRRAKGANGTNGTRRPNGTNGAGS